MKEEREQYNQKGKNKQTNKKIQKKHNASNYLTPEHFKGKHCIHLIPISSVDVHQKHFSFQIANNLFIYTGLKTDGSQLATA